MRSPLASVIALAALSSASALSRAALPAEKCVVLSPYRVAASDAARFEQQFASTVDDEDSSFLLLRRRNDVSMYGKLHDSYPAGTADYQAMSVFADACCADGCSPLVPPSDACEPLSARPRLWDATIVQRPLLAPAVLTPGTPLFLAMNRFPVRADCALDFEERWASRNSKLGSDGVDLLGFSLLRRRAPIGADETYTIEALMQNGWALQSGTSHFLGQNFARAFDVKFQTKEQTSELVWATSWGVSTRLLGALVMTHSDDSGLVLPPAVAPHQLVVVPVGRGKPDNDAKVDAFLDELSSALGKTGVRFHIDMRDMKPGPKFYDWERKGVPLRLEVSAAQRCGLLSSGWLDLVLGSLSRVLRRVWSCCAGGPPGRRQRRRHCQGPVRRGQDGDPLRCGVLRRHVRQGAHVLAREVRSGDGA